MILKDTTPKLGHFTNSLVLFLVSTDFYYMATYQKLEKTVERSIRWKARFERRSNRIWCILAAEGEPFVEKQNKPRVEMKHEASPPLQRNKQSQDKVTFSLLNQP